MHSAAHAINKKTSASGHPFWPFRGIFAGSRSGCVSWSRCWVAKPWRSRFSKRRSPSHGQKTELAVAPAASRRYPVKTLAATLGVVRSNVIERRDGDRPRAGRSSVPAMSNSPAQSFVLSTRHRPNGYRRIAALLKRERQADGAALVNAKRVYRLMKKHSLLLERHTGRRDRASTTARWQRSARIAAGARMHWSSPAGTARSCALAWRLIAMTAKSSAGWPRPPASPAR